MKPLLVLSLVVLFSTAAAAQTKTVAVQLLANPPYTYVSETGAVSGFLPDLFKLLKVPGYQWDLQSRPWARALEATKVDKTGLVLLPTLTRTPERETGFRWVTPLTSPRYFFIGRPPLDPKLTPSDLKDRTVTVLLNNASDNWLRAKGFSNLEEVPSLEQMVKMVMGHRADFLLKDITSLPFFLRSTGLGPQDLVLGPEVKELALPLYMAGSLDFDAGLAEALDKEMARLRKSGVLEQLWNRWQ